MSVVGLFCLAAIIACAISLVRSGRTHKLGLAVLVGPVVILAILVGAVLAFRRERRLFYTEPNGYRPTRSATLLRPTLDLLPRFPRLYAVWRGRGIHHNVHRASTGNWREADPSSSGRRGREALAAPP
jgi:hypothetical protein